jgi:hypothetical protein
MRRHAEWDVVVETRISATLRDDFPLRWGALRFCFRRLVWPHIPEIPLCGWKQHQVGKLSGGEYPVKDNPPSVRISTIAGPDY